MTGSAPDPQFGEHWPDVAPGTADIAVVIGTYNRIDYLRRCVDSVVRETKRSFKLYITDAGSSDGTIEYLNSIRGPRIEIFLVGPG